MEDLARGACNLSVAARVRGQYSDDLDNDLRTGGIKFWCHSVFSSSGDPMVRDLRLDRLLTLYLKQSMPRQTGIQSQVPILMYHSVQSSDSSNAPPYYRTVTSPQAFARQMAYLHASGYSTLGLDELQKRIQDGRNLDRCVVITFDDGYGDFYVHAFPILASCNFSATVFLPTAHIGSSRRCFNGNPCLTWSEIRELSRAGISFGSHTVTHPQLRYLPQQEVYHELCQSKETIEQELGKAIDSFAYPFAFPETDAAFRARLSVSLEMAGYENGVCTTIGRAGAGRSRWFMKRLPVNSDDDPQLFEAKLSGGYDWVSVPQLWFKKAKDWLPYPAYRTTADAQ